MNENNNRNTKTHGSCKSYRKVRANATVSYCKTKSDAVKVCVAILIDGDHIQMWIRSGNDPVLRQQIHNRSKDVYESPKLPLKSHRFLYCRYCLLFS